MSGTIANSRAIEAVLARLQGPPALSQLLVHSLEATGSVPMGACAIPEVNGGLFEEGTVFVRRNPATADGSWPVVQAGTLVSVESIQGGEHVNLPGSTLFRWDEPREGIELVSEAPAPLVGGARSEAFAALRAIRQYKSLSSLSIEEFFRAQAAVEYPAAVLCWAGANPLDGPMAAAPGPRSARVARGRMLFRHAWIVYLITSRLDSEGQRRREGEQLRDDVLEILIDATGARSGQLRVSTDPGIEIISTSVAKITPTSYVDRVEFATRVVLERRKEGETFSPWLSTRLRQQTAVQAGSPLDLPDARFPMVLPEPES